MKNITVSVDEETHRLARIRAAELDTSVSALVREFLHRLAGSDVKGTSADEQRAETDLQRRRRLLDEFFADFDAQGAGLGMSQNLTREELYDEAINGPSALR